MTETYGRMAVKQKIQLSTSLDKNFTKGKSLRSKVTWGPPVREKYFWPLRSSLRFFQEIYKSYAHNPSFKVDRQVAGRANQQFVRRQYEFSKDVRRHRARVRLESQN
jgi:hypothetical protein